MRSPVESLEAGAVVVLVAGAHLALATAAVANVVAMTALCQVANATES